MLRVTTTFTPALSIPDQSWINCPLEAHLASQAMFITEDCVQAIEHAIATSGQANKRALARKHLIEKRKEEQERLLLEQEREQEEQRMIQLRISEEAEEKRRKADM